MEESMEELSDKFYYLYSSEVPERIQIKIGTLEGKRNKPTYEELLKDPHLKFSGVCQDGCSDLMVECQVWDNNEPLSLPVSTEYKPFTTRWNWNEWLHLPLEFCDLPRTAQLAITVYDCAGPDSLTPVGGTTLSLFSKHGVFREGMIDLRVWPHVVADGRTPTTTPGKGHNGKDNFTDQMWKLAKLEKKHRNGHIPKVDWLNRLTFRELEVIREKEKRSSSYMYLTVEFQKVFLDNVLNHVVYFEQNDDSYVPTTKTNPDLVFVPDAEIGKVFNNSLYT